MSNRQILIVDDDADTCAVLADLLADLGYETDTAQTGLNALELAERNVYQLALLDYKMPNLTGVELFGRLRQHIHGIHGFLVTAHAASAVTREATDAGMERIFQKPVNVVELMSGVRSAVN
jgi:CheY-like chemotaxis protein